MQVAQTYVKVLYDGINISEDISDSLMSITYTDHVKGKADEVEIKLDDSKGLFQNAWYPDKGSRLTIDIIHEGNTLNCGVFSIDEINVTGPPDTVTWRGISALITSKMRTKNSKGYENTTLLDIAKDIAKNHDLEVDDGTKTIKMKRPDTKEEQTKMKVLAEFSLKISKEQNKTFFYQEISALFQQILPVIKSLDKKGYEKESKDLRIAVSVLQANMDSINAAKLSGFISRIRVELYQEPTTKNVTLGLGLSKIKLERSTQYRETDLEYLSKISAQYGLAFNIKPPLMIFYSLFHLEDAPTALSIDKSQCSTFEITDKTEGTYSDVSAKYHDPYSNKTIKNTLPRPGTTSEQGILSVLFQAASKAGTLIDKGSREKAIQGLNTQTTNCLKGLKTKGYASEYEGLLNSYATLINDKSVTGCVRFANYCKELKGTLIKLQAENIEIMLNKDSYAGGQKSDVLNIRIKAEDKEQADAIAKSALHSHNSKTRTGSLSMPGTLLMVAGNNFTLTGVGKLSGKYSIVSSTHTVEKNSGYTVSSDFKLGATKP